MHLALRTGHLEKVKCNVDPGIKRWLSPGEANDGQRPIQSAGSL